MSQVKFKTSYQGKPCEVMAGWDRPLAEFYMTLFDLDPEADDETFWSAIAFPSDVDRKSTLRLRTKLVEFGITPPDGFWERVERREANVTHVLTPTGWESY